MHQIITIGREFGSGGRELGRRLAKALGYAYYDREIVTAIAKKTDLGEDYVNRMLESNPLNNIFPITIGRSFYPVHAFQFSDQQQAGQLYAEQMRIMAELAEQSPCVMVGRCADVILRDRDPWRLFVYSDEAAKIARCMQRQPREAPMNEKAMRRQIHEVDSNRRSFYEFHTGLKWGAPLNYDLCINTTGKDIAALAAGLAALALAE